MSGTITMDNAGRIVLPKPLRERFRLEGGARLRVEMVGDHLELTPEAPEAPSVVRKKGLLVVSASGAPSDAAAAVRADREDREDDLTGRGRSGRER